jgi:hypothetical protein
LYSPGVRFSSVNSPLASVVACPREIIDVFANDRAWTVAPAMPCPELTTRPRIISPTVSVKSLGTTSSFVKTSEFSDTVP